MYIKKHNQLNKMYHQSNQNTQNCLNYCTIHLEDFFQFHRNSMTRMHYLRINKLLRIKYLWEFYKKTSAELTNNLTNLQVEKLYICVLLTVQ